MPTEADLRAANQAQNAKIRAAQQAGNLTPGQASAQYLAAGRLLKQQLMKLGQQTQAGAAAQQQVNVANKVLAQNLQKAARAVGGSAYATPRQFIAAARGNVANTGRNVGLGIAAGAVGLAASASPIGIETVMGPLRLLASTIGSILLPRLVDLGEALLNASDKARQNPIGAGLHVALPAAGAAAGAWGGALGGMAVGTAVLPGIGTAVGGVIGAIGGGLAGMGAGKIGANVADFARSDKDKMELPKLQQLKNREMILQEMQQKMMSGASTGKAQDAWARIQGGMVMSPFEREQLRIWTENLAELRKELVAELKKVNKGVNGPGAQ